MILSSTSFWNFPPQAIYTLRLDPEYTAPRHLYDWDCRSFRPKVGVQPWNLRIPVAMQPLLLVCFLRK